MLRLVFEEFVAWVQIGDVEGENVMFMKAAERGLRAGSVDMSVSKEEEVEEEDCCDATSATKGRKERKSMVWD